MSDVSDTETITDNSNNNSEDIENGLCRNCICKDYHNDKLVEMINILTKNVNIYDTKITKYKYNIESLNKLIFDNTNYNLHTNTVQLNEQNSYTKTNFVEKNNNINIQENKHYVLYKRIIKQIETCKIKLKLANRNKDINLVEKSILINIIQNDGVISVDSSNEDNSDDEIDSNYESDNESENESNNEN